MCFYFKLSKTAIELQNRFNARFEIVDQYRPAIFNGFQFPKTPVILNSEPGIIQLLNWGLIPHWAKDNSIRKNTLNGRIETINEKPAFRNSVKNRCLILVDGFYEWQWLDSKGKNKKKFFISVPGDEAFALAGLWSEWVDKNSGEIVKTYTILTTAANELMSIIHNSKKRMPVVLNSDNEKDWLNGKIFDTVNVELKATELS